MYGSIRPCIERGRCIMTERILVDNELFLGRVDEQNRFRTLLDTLLQSERWSFLLGPAPDAPEWSHVILLYGVGGMGKSTLSKRLRDIAGGHPPDQRYQHKFRVLWLD